MYILLTKCIRAYYVRKYDVSHRGKWCDERVHIYFSHIIPTRKARVIYESCSTSLFIYTRTYTHTHTQSYFHCHCWHTRLLHDLHLCLWTQRHRNPSVEHSRSVRLTFRRYFLFSFTLLSFCHPTEMAPSSSVLDDPREWRKRPDNRESTSSQNCLVEIFGVDSDSRGEKIEGAGAIPWGLSSWLSRKVRGSSREQSLLTLLLWCLPSIIPTLSHWKNVNVVIQDRRDGSYSYIWIYMEKYVIRMSICMPSLRVNEIVIWICTDKNFAFC